MGSSSGQVNTVSGLERVFLAVNVDDQFTPEDPDAFVLGMTVGGVIRAWHIVPFVGFVTFLMEPGLDLFL
jgi:hypothetical protein